MFYLLRFSFKFPPVHISIIPETIFHIFGLPITNTLITSWAVVIALSLLAFLFAKTFKKIPGLVQSAVEWALEALLKLMETVTGSRREAEKLFPFIATIFIFVLAANWIGILPGVGSIGIFEIHGEEKEFLPLFRSVNSDLNMTLALAVLAVTVSHILGFAASGIAGHVKTFINFKSPLGFGVGVLELVSEGAKVISFSFRLFGNVFAGEVLLVIISFLIPYVAPVPFLGLELFVGLIQALIFAILTLVFITSFTKAETPH